MKKRMIAILLASAMVSLAACGTTNEAPAATEAEADAMETIDAAATEAAVADSGKTYKVGVCQLMQHNALDAATQGFVDTLTGKYGDAIEIDVQNAQGDSATCATIVNGFVSNEYDLILANATPALQAAQSSTTTIPILGTSVTDYGTALGMSDFTGTTGTNISGTSDMAPLDQQEDMILELVPDVKKIAILYCSAEANSSFQVQQIEKYLDEDGIAYEEFTFSDSNDLGSVVNNAVVGVDAMYIPTDNVVASNMPLVTQATGAVSLPVICGEENMCAGGGLATLSIDYYDLGVATGNQAIDILENGTDPAGMEIWYATATTKKYNAAYAAQIGVTVPESYEVIEGTEAQ